MSTCPKSQASTSAGVQQHHLDKPHITAAHHFNGTDSNNNTNMFCFIIYNNYYIFNDYFGRLSIGCLCGLENKQSVVYI